MSENYKIKYNIYISGDEFVFKASKSSGPGGQHVNKVNTRVSLYFDVNSSESFSEGQKKKTLKKLQSRANNQGVLRIVSQKFRSQKANRKAAIEKLIGLLRDCLKKRKRRKKTEPSYKSKLERLEEKKQRSQVKRQRKKKRFDLGDFDY